MRDFFNSRLPEALMGLSLIFLLTILITYGVDRLTVERVAEDKPAGAVGTMRESRTDPAETEMKREDGSEIPCVVVDAGHGGRDPGKVSPDGLAEKEINLAIALSLRDILVARGVEVVMTRQTDESLNPTDNGNRKIADLKERCRIVDESGCCLVVSIHQNSYHEASVRGPQMFYYKHSEAGKRAAQLLREACNGFAADTNRAEKANDNYYLLLNTKAPVVICECGFLSNAEDAALLADEAYRCLVAESLAEGIIHYLES